MKDHNWRSKDLTKSACRWNQRSVAEIKPEPTSRPAVCWVQCRESRSKSVARLDEVSDPLSLCSRCNFPYFAPWFTFWPRIVTILKKTLQSLTPIEGDSTLKSIIFTFPFHQYSSIVRTWILNQDKKRRLETSRFILWVFSCVVFNIFVLWYGFCHLVSRLYLLNSRDFRATLYVYLISFFLYPRLIFISFNPVR